MDLIFQALVESLHEGTLPLAFVIIWIWRWDRPFMVQGMSSDWSHREIYVPAVRGKNTGELGAIEAYSGRMQLVKSVKRKDCPDDSDDAQSSPFFLRAF
ncbi:hypothetical protein [Jeotgalibacillus soli]|uniref:Uncharacterized protein n=1 Tax=Jeotgalibacillus soli TaxID=889306 RepID=A0A0C2SDX4_9BACL|nr:hypothetical protein [Jeotgalibacillus soli]KIL52154.1 hypothetical protein KP78_05240 [Jeotgalibacillus soli]